VQFTPCSGWPCREKKLGWPSLLLEGSAFEVSEVGGRIAAEAGPQDPGVEPLFQAASGFPPCGGIDRRQIRGGDRGQTGERGGEDADRAAHDQARRGDFAACGAPLVIALGTEELFQIIVIRFPPECIGRSNLLKSA
jgi:hypothetical protein